MRHQTSSRARERANKRAKKRAILRVLKRFPEMCQQSAFGRSRSHGERAFIVRSAIDEERTLSGVQAFVVDLDDDFCVDGEAAVGSDMGAAICVWVPGFAR